MDEESLKQIAQNIRICKSEGHAFESYAFHGDMERCPNCGMLKFLECPPEHKNCPGDPSDCREN